MKKKKIAITGANGYLGMGTIKKALSQNWDVNAIVRRNEVIKELQLLGSKVFLVKNFEIPSLTEAFENCTAILHFANIVCGSKEIFEKVNIQGLKNILEAAKIANVSKIIYPSGLGVDKYNIVEWAKNEYFRSKFEAEKILKQANIPYIIFRPSYIVGPHDELIPEIINQIVDGEVIIAGDGNIPMQPIYLNDAITAFLSATSEERHINRIYDLVGPQIITMNDLVELVIKKLSQFGFNVPRPKITHISYEEAPEKLDICAEMVDVMRCDLTPNGNITTNDLGFELTPLSVAIDAAISTKIGTNIKFNTKKRAILLLSGGIDSATALYWGINQGYEIIALSLLYQWRAKNEITAARKLTELTNIKLIEVPFIFMQQATDLKMEGYPIPSVFQAPQGFIPMRNLVFYSVAAYFAETYGCELIIGGHIMKDTSTFPDARPKFFTDLISLINDSKHASDKTRVHFLLPLINLTKSEVIKLGKELNLPFEFTWSCYGDFKKPCNECKPCTDRKNAFLENDLDDPTFKNNE
ncbi:MAG: 7-cyano-7-deazaguanine synthase [Candidatus Lokiarchaeota archaeon]|nr:7-cyano-7-deazaguanine synthase [Candidatus Lokiarchaeota archaeon]